MSASKKSPSTSAPARLTLPAVNRELAKRGHRAMLMKADGYFYFRGGEATDWLDRTVRVPTLKSLTLDKWMEAFDDLKKKNQQIAGDSSAVPPDRGRRTRRPGGGVKKPDRGPGADAGIRPTE